MAPAPLAPSGPGYFVNGKLFCYPAHWTDVGKFILLNYGLHVVTTIPRPGERTAALIYRGFTAFTAPIIHAVRAIDVVMRSSPALFHRTSDLERAHMARALCMIVNYKDGEPEDDALRDIKLSVISVPFHKTHDS